ncbi:MAG TPA: response regulator [Chryseolinea sp.]|nr:response regulator [Chryseolinea sp.]HPM30222.1 response regulator [Chryseolinea sp.]
MTKSILLIDDERIFCFIAEKLIISTGVDAKIMKAETGQQGLDLVRENFEATGSLPLLILVDFYMSPMDGITFVKLFHELNIPGNEQTSIALTTSSVFASDFELAKSAGVYTFLDKPISEIKLKEVLTKAGLL